MVCFWLFVLYLVSTVSFTFLFCVISVVWYLVSVVSFLLCQLSNKLAVGDFAWSWHQSPPHSQTLGVICAGECLNIALSTQLKALLNCQTMFYVFTTMLSKTKVWSSHFQTVVKGLGWGIVIRPLPAVAGRPTGAEKPSGIKSLSESWKEKENKITWSWSWMIRRKKHLLQASA